MIKSDQEKLVRMVETGGVVTVMYPLARHSGARAARTPESRDSPMRNCASVVWSGACHRAALRVDPLGPSRN